MSISVPKHLSISDTLRFFSEQDDIEFQRRLHSELTDEQWNESFNCSLHLKAAWSALFKINKKKEFFSRPVTAYIAGTSYETLLK